MTHDPADYIRRLQDESQRYTQDLLTDNERLRLQLAGQAAEISSLRHELAGRDGTRAELETRLLTAEAESRRFLDEYSKIELESSSLTHLCVANQGLHGTLERSDVLQIVQEIVANLVGSEEMALFEMDDNGSVLRLVGSFGVDRDAFRTVPVGEGLIGRVAQTGEPYYVDRHGRDGALPIEGALTACIPLILCGRVVGALAVLRLLSHKPRLEAKDDELLDLLTSQVAMALYCTGLHARYAAERAALSLSS